MSIEPLPFVSVIIPTYNRKDSLLRTLDSLARQTYPADRFEVLVVDDGSSDETEDVTQRVYPFALHYLRQENAGEIVARNNGALHSNGELLVFVDDDIEASSEYLATMVAIHQTHPKSVVLGALADPPAGEQADGVHSNQFPPLPGHQQQTPMPEPATYIDCMSGVVSISRQGFSEIGTMQPLRTGEGRNIWGGIDFGYRAQQHGFAFWRAPNAVAIHHDATSTLLQSRCRRGYRVSSEVHQLFAKYPAIKGQIPMFRDKGPIAWRQDSPTLTLRKLARQAASSQAAMWAMKTAMPFLERHTPDSKLLSLLDRWIVSGYIYRGYRDGLQSVGEAQSRSQQ